MDLDIFTSRNQCSPTLILNDKQYFDRDVYEELKQDLELQYIDFGDLGINKLEDVDYIYKERLYNDFIDYVVDTYMPISNYEETKFSTNKLIKIGDLLYSFLIIDCYNIFIPNYLEDKNLVDIDSFNKYFSTTLNSDPALFRNSFVSVIDKILKKFFALKSLYDGIDKDDNYRIYIENFAYYLELLNFCNPELFLDNYFRPVLSINGADLLERIT